MVSFLEAVAERHPVRLGRCSVVQRTLFCHGPSQRCVGGFRDRAPGLPVCRSRGCLHAVPMMLSSRFQVKVRATSVSGVLSPAGSYILVENPPLPRQIHFMKSVFSGPVYVVRDNIDTDQIIPAQYLTLVPTIPDEYEKLGSYALCGLPDSLYPIRFVREGQLDSGHPIVVGGKNFGCGSSREHAPIALGSAGCKIVLAEGFARIFFRNCVATGEVYPCECVDRLCDILKTGERVTVDLDAATVTRKSDGKVYRFKALGEVRPVVD